MIGRQVVNKLFNYDLLTPTKEELNLLDFSAVENYFSENKPNKVIHLGGYNGGLLFNKNFPEEIFFRTTTMGLNVIRSSVLHNVEKIVFIVPSCALNPDASEASEDDLYRSQPHPSVECHGLAKRAVEAYGRQSEKQHGIKFITCVANNSFGPKDRFDEGGKVISGMIQKIYEAKINGDEEVVFWGTGKPLREFIYCADIAYIIVQLLNKDIPSPIIATSDYEISIYDLAHKIAKIMCYRGKITFDDSKPDGQMRKKLNSDKMRKYLDVNITPFDEALSETIDWYMNNV